MTFQRGHIAPWWDTGFKQFAYEYLPHKDPDMVAAWQAQGYHNFNLNGAIHNLNDNDYAQPFLDFFGWKNSGAALYKMNTGDVLPVHQDHYMTYRRVFDITDTSTIWRVIIFMEPWATGHYFEIAGHPIANWQAGDYVMWNYNVPHMAANIGTVPRYTMQVTGQVV
jgi:hypothetical protein